MKPRHVLSRWLRKRGYDFIKLDPFVEALKTEYQAVDAFNFIQIGANDGIMFDDLFGFVASHRCNGLVVEPLTFYYEKLKLTYAGLDSVRPLNVAIHRSDSEAIIHFPDPARLDELPEWSRGIGSFNFSHHQAHNIPTDAMIEERVRCIDFEQLIAESGFDKLSLLQIDTEGYDAEIIRMIDFKTITPRIIKYESKSFSEQEFREIEALLSNNGYTVTRQRSNTIAVLGA